MVAVAAPGPAPGAARPAFGPAAAVTSFGLTAAHFAVALCFLVAGGAGLVWVAPALAGGRYLSPEVVAVAHLFTLGWLTTSIMGALYQLVPVVLSTGVRWPRAGYAGLLLFAPGLAAFLAGVLAGQTGLTVAGAFTFAAGLLVFAANVGASLRRAPVRDLTWWALAGALVFLVVTVILGASLAGNLRWSYLGERRLLAVGVHMHVALGGWVLLLAIGVARKLLPMFLLSHGGSERAGTVAAVLTAAGAGVLALFHHAPGPLVAWPAALLLAGGAGSFAVQAAVYVRHGRRPSLDNGLRLALAGVALLAAAIPLGFACVAGGFLSRHLAAAYGTTIVLAFTLFVAGHYYKILPFLVWNRYFAPLVGTGRPLPKVTDLFDGRVAGAAALLLAAGSVGVASGTLLGLPLATRAAAPLFAVGAGVLALQMVNIYRVRPRT